MFGNLASGLAASLVLWTSVAAAREWAPSAAATGNAAGPSADHRLKIPRRYLESAGGAPVSGGMVILRAKYPSMEPEPPNEQAGIPGRDSVRIVVELATGTPAQQDIGQFMLNANLSGVRGLVELDSRSVGQKVRLFQSPDKREDAMGFTDASGKTVFVSCVVSKCLAQRSWGSSHVISYQFDRLLHSQAVAMDTAVMNLLRSFE